MRLYLDVTEFHGRSRESFIDRQSSGRVVLFLRSTEYVLLRWYGRSVGQVCVDDNTSLNMLLAWSNEYCDIRFQLSR